MAKQRRPIVDYSVYLIIRMGICILQTLPWGLARVFADAFGWIAYRVDRRHRQVGLDNLKHAFPDKTEAEHDQIVRGVYRHFMLMLVEMFKAPRVIHKHNIEYYLAYPSQADYERALAIYQSGRPLILLGGHFGNWEIYGYAGSAWGATLTAIARPLDNPYLDRYLHNFRCANGNRIIDKKGDYDQIEETLKENGHMGILCDQDAGMKGLFVDFFGKPASTFKSLALLAMQFQAPILLGGAARVGFPMRYHILLEDVIYPEEYADRPDAVREITQRFTSALERLVRKHPEQYLWLHRRWKHQPKVKAAKKAAA